MERSMGLAGGGVRGTCCVQDTAVIVEESTG